MKKRKLLIWLFSLIVFFSSCSPRKNKEQITILFTNDLQARVLAYPKNRGGMARIATVVNKIKKENPHTILLDAGDASVGSAFATETRGEAIYQIMNAVGYNASVYGNHEFDLGAEQAKKYQQIAHFPLLACNIRDEQGKSFAQEYAIFKLGSLKLAVVGVANPHTPNLVDQSRIRGLKFLPPETEIRRVQHELSSKADLIILLTHQGIDEDTSLAWRIKGIPLIIGGHSEIKINGFRKVRGVLIAQAGHFGWWLGRIDFLWDAKKKRAYKFHCRLIPITSKIPEDPEVVQTIQHQQSKLPSGLDRVIGRTWKTLSKDYLGYWVAELIKAETKSDFGIINTGGVRSEIYRGEITPRMIYYLLPFQDKICSFEISGRDLLKIKHIHYFYFSRGKRIKPDKIYRVGSIDFLLRINDFPGAKNPKIYPQLLRNLIIKRIEKDGGIKRFWER